MVEFIGGFLLNALGNLHFTAWNLKLDITTHLEQSSLFSLKVNIQTDVFVGCVAEFGIGLEVVV